MLKKTFIIVLGMCFIFHKVYSSALASEYSKLISKFESIYLNEQVIEQLVKLAQQVIQNGSPELKNKAKLLDSQEKPSFSSQRDFLREIKQELIKHHPCYITRVQEILFNQPNSEVLPKKDHSSTSTVTPQEKKNSTDTPKVIDTRLKKRSLLEDLLKGIPATVSSILNNAVSIVLAVLGLVSSVLNPVLSLLGLG